MDKGQCPLGHQMPSGTPDKTRTQSNFAPLQQLAVVCSTEKESIHFSVFQPMPQPNSLLLRLIEPLNYFVTHY